jgi:hypothetical protein
MHPDGVIRDGRSLLLPLIACAALAAVPRPAPCQDSPAKEHFERGIILYKAGDYEGALEHFLISNTLRPHYQTAYNIAMCHSQLGEKAQAANELAKTLVLEGEEMDHATSKKILGKLEQLKAALGYLVVEADAMGSTVMVDGTIVGATPLGRGIYVEPGTHSLTVMGLGGGAWSADVTVGEGENLQVNVVMKGAKVATTIEKVESQPLIVGKKPAEPLGEQAVPPPPDRKVARLRSAGWGLLGAGGALLLAGAISGGIALSRSGEVEDLDDGCIADNCTARYNDYIEYKDRRVEAFDAMKLSAGLSTSLLCVGGIAALAGIVSLSLSASPLLKRREKPAGAPSASVGLSAGGLAFGLVF